MIVQPVDSRYLHHVWLNVEPHLKKGLQYAGDDFTIEQVKVYLSTGMWQLIVFVDDEAQEIKGALTVEYSNRPNDRVAFVTNFGGIDVVNGDNMSQIAALLKANGATIMEGACRPSAKRLFEQKLGAKEKFSVIEVSL